MIIEILSRESALKYLLFRAITSKICQVLFPYTEITENIAQNIFICDFTGDFA
jgi:hypothetical protein